MLSREIDGIMFKVGKLDVFDANDLDRTLQELIPVILDGIESAQPESGDLLDTDFGSIAGAVRKLFEAMPSEKFRGFSVGMLASTKAVVNDNEIALTSTETIGGIGLKVSGLYKLLFAVMEENGFIPFDLVAFGGGTERILSLLGVTKGTKKSNEKSEKSES